MARQAPRAAWPDQPAAVDDLDPNWLAPPESVELRDDEVHLWQANLDCGVQQVERLRAWLSQDEVERADRFRFGRDRRRFEVGRGVLRAVLAGYVGARPDELQFTYGPAGKPQLAGDDHLTIRFNVSHSNELAVYAVTTGREVGIDVEHVREVPDAEQIARAMFSPRESEAIRGVPRSRRIVAFLRCWTLKEAYVKARGEGLTVALSEFEVSLVEGRQPTRLVSTGDPVESSRWSLLAFSTWPGYLVALAVEGCDWQPRWWVWGHEH